MATQLITSISTDNYVSLIEENGIGVTTNEIFLTAGQIPEDVSWVLHISVILPQVETLLFRLLPLFKSSEVVFSMPKNTECATIILYGILGYEQFAKVMTIYPTDNKQAVWLVTEIQKCTGDLRGPIIPTAAPLGGVLYTQYFGKIPFEESLWPFSTKIPHPITQHKKKFFGKYMIIDTLKPDLKGDVFKGIYLERLWRPRKCVIKQGRANMWTDEKSREIGDRLHWQKEIQEKLQGIVRLPKAIDLFKADGHTYLVMEFIDAIQFESWVKQVYSQRKWPQLNSLEQEQLVGYLIRIVEIVAKLHQHGFIHRDVTPANFMLNRKDEIVLIDMELAYSMTTNYPDPPFGNGTYGFMSQEQLRHEKPTVKEDIFGLGGMMVYFFTGEAPEKFNYQFPDALLDEILKYKVPETIAKTVKQCYSLNPDERPTTEDIREALLRF